MTLKDDRVFSFEDYQERERKKSAPSWRDHVFTAEALQNMSFPPPQWVITGIIPEGLTILAGRPKIGKSWMALEIAVAVASGRPCLGESLPSKGDVLYAALEDNPRRLQQRLHKILPTFSGIWPDRLTLATNWRHFDKGGIQDIAGWADERDKPCFMIFDTFARVKPKHSQKGYEIDYAALEPLHRFANDRGIGALIVHHTRKAEADDPLDTISGTLGLAGCADTALVISRSTKGTSLYIRGRDVEEAEHAIEFSKESFRWRILGNAADVHRSEQRAKILEVLSIANEPASPQEITVTTGMKRGNVDRLLGKMVAEGEIRRIGRGKYTL